MTTCPINIQLNNGAQMPALGFGTWPPTDEKDFENAVNVGLETGYRHIDTASAYHNEHILGRVLRKWIESGKGKREELFIVSKLPVSGIRASAVEKSIKKSLQDLQFEYVDLYLVHAPFGYQDSGLKVMQDMDKMVLDTETDLIATWKAMEAQVDAGRAKAIGISNFNEKQIQRILDVARIRPANLQVELHVYNQQRPLVEFCQTNNISVVAYSPLGSGGSAQFLKEKMGDNFKLPDLLNDETVVRIGAKHKKSAAHVLLRHILQRGVAAIPKSSNPGRIRSNFQVFDFELDSEDVAALDKLDRGAEGRIFDFTFMPGAKDHPEYPF